MVNTEKNDVVKGTFYYIDTIEQVVAAEDFPYNVNEYGARSKKSTDWNETLVKFYEKLEQVSNDIIDENHPDKKHYYMDIRIVDNSGEVCKKDKLGVRQDIEKKPEPTPEPTPETEG